MGTGIENRKKEKIETCTVGVQTTTKIIKEELDTVLEEDSWNMRINRCKL